MDDKIEFMTFYRLSDNEINLLSQTKLKFEKKLNNNDSDNIKSHREVLEKESTDKYSLEEIAGMLISEEGILEKIIHQEEIKKFSMVVRNGLAKHKSKRKIISEYKKCTSKTIRKFLTQHDIDTVFNEEYKKWCR